MNEKTKFKIMDSVDLFLSNNNYLLVYYNNSRQKRSFRVNEEMIHLLECIDGNKSFSDIKKIMAEKWKVLPSSTCQTLELLQKNRIVSEIIDEQFILSSETIERYSRQINYFSEFLGSELAGISAQKKLMMSHVLIFGCGAIGGNIAIQLAMAGVKKFTLYDYATTRVSDISRHIYYREEYVGLNKIEALKKEMFLIDSEIDVKAHQERMHPKTDIEDLIRNVDFVVNTLDEPYIGYTSAKISRVCMKLNKPHYIAGGFDAHLASTGELIIPYVTPCVECYASYFKTSLKNWKPKKHPVIRRICEIGGLSSMSLFSSSFACIEIVKYIAGLVPMIDNYKKRGEFLFHDMSLTYLDVNKNPNCPVCGKGINNET